MWSQTPPTHSCLNISLGRTLILIFAIVESEFHTCNHPHAVVRSPYCAQCSQLQPNILPRLESSAVSVFGQADACTCTCVFPTPAFCWGLCCALGLCPHGPCCSSQPGLAWHITEKTQLCNFPEKEVSLEGLTRHVHVALGRVFVASLSQVQLVCNIPGKSVKPFKRWPQEAFNLLYRYYKHSRQNQLQQYTLYPFHLLFAVGVVNLVVEDMCSCVVRYSLISLNIG